uniref:Uncharacterized protein n=1 Tax=Tanacetum cinerariifolium TaxID=118510 RepID=A0A6L2NVX6_TANCI|nr:hypothetical protein [Tanacetum cinerariifolium]
MLMAVPVKAPAFGKRESHFLDDIAIHTGGNESCYGFLATMIWEDAVQELGITTMRGCQTLNIDQALENFKSHVGVGSWFSSLEYASNTFLIDKKVVWVDIEGVPLKIIVNGKVFWICAKEVCGWVLDFLEDEEEGDESDKDTFDDEFGKDNSKAHMNFNSEGDSDKEEI